MIIVSRKSRFESPVREVGQGGICPRCSRTAGGADYPGRRIGRIGTEGAASWGLAV
uniref:hypothetical protein n=1 Tax=Enterocloster aldenensis TaxID=358742 RepID=UPI0022E92F92